MKPGLNRGEGRLYCSTSTTVVKMRRIPMLMVMMMMMMRMMMKMMRMIIMMTIDRHYCGKDKDDHGDGDVTDGDPDHDGD